MAYPIQLELPLEEQPEGTITINGKNFKLPDGYIITKKSAKPTDWVRRQDKLGIEDHLSVADPYERSLVYQRKYRSLKWEQCKAAQRRWYHSEKGQRFYANYREAHREKARAYYKEYYAKHREELLKKQSLWRAQKKAEAKARRLASHKRIDEEHNSFH